MSVELERTYDAVFPNSRYPTRYFLHSHTNIYARIIVSRAEANNFCLRPGSRHLVHRYPPHPSVLSVDHTLQLPAVLEVCQVSFQSP